MVSPNETPAQTFAPQMTSRRLQSLIDWSLEAWLVAIGTWTAIYHVALVIGLDRTVTTLVWIVTTAVAMTVLSRMKGHTDNLNNRTFVLPKTALWYLGSAGLLATIFAVFRPEGAAFTLIWAALLLFLVSAATQLLRRSPAAKTAAETPSSEGPAHNRPSTGRIAFVIALALASALLSSVAQRPDLDDVFLVNQSTYVESNAGSFATRDTIFGDEVFASSRPANPQTSVESLIGTVSAALPVNAATTTYLLWGSLISLLAVTALWKLLRTLGVPNAEYALALATVYLLLNGGVHASFGNFGVVRSWQGKSALLMVVVPLLWHYGLRFGRHGRGRDLIFLGLGNIAAVGLSTSGIFIAPSVTGLAVLASVAFTADTSKVSRLSLGLSTTIYPIGAAAWAYLAEAQDKTPRILSFIGARNSVVTSPASEWPWYSVLGSGWGLGLAILAILAAWLLLSDQGARLALLLAPIAVLVIFTAPGAIERIDGILSSNAVLWRSMWIMPIPAAIGILLASPAFLPPSRYRVAAVIVLPLVALGGLALTETHTLSSDNGVTIARPAWDVANEDRVALEQIRGLTEPGNLVAAPESIGAAIAISTVEIRAINPRNTATDSFGYLPSFNSDLRLLLSWGVEFGIPGERFDDTRASLDILGVDLLCIRPALIDDPITNIVAEEGYVNVVTDGECAYWRKLSSGS